MKTPPTNKAEKAIVAPRYLIDILDEVRLEPLFPVPALTPTSRCGHKGPIRKGSSFCCMVCAQSGMDHMPCMHRNPKTDPKPERTKYRKGKLKGGR